MMASTLCAAFVIQQPYISIHTSIPSSHRELQTDVSYRLYTASTNNNDDKDTTTSSKIIASWHHIIHQSQSYHGYRKWQIHIK